MPRGAEAAGGQVQPLVVRLPSDAGTRTPTRVPEGKDFNPSWVSSDSVVKVVPDATYEDAPNSSKAGIASHSADLGMARDEFESTRQVFRDGIGRC